MGCDIHLYTETRVNGKWVCDQANSLTNETEYEPDEAATWHMYSADNAVGAGRDYWFFGFLQPGVRAIWDFSFDERIEVPEDISDEVKKIFDGWDVDGHSHGYRTLAEMQDKLEEMKVERTKILLQPIREVNPIIHCFDRLERAIETLKAEKPDVDPNDRRIIFCFDN